MKVIKYIITLVLLVLLYFFIYKNIIKVDGFENSSKIPTLEGSHFVHLYDDKGNKLNVVLVSKPFSSDTEYRQYMQNMGKLIYLGISSYMEFPHMPTNPEDNYEIEQFGNPYHLDMYFEMCKGWLHCFKNPEKFIPTDKPYELISESDFVNYKQLTPPENVEKEFDFMYSCPKVSESSHCDDWVSHNKNWALALKCLPILCEKYKLKGLLIGRKDCEIPEGCKPYITTTGWLDYGEHVKQYSRCKFLFVPNQRDASPRVITEALAFNIAILVNTNILGGWKYVTEQTGELFTDETDIAKSLDKLIPRLPKYTPRQYIIDNYGPINSGRRLKKFIYDNFGDKVNIKECDYVVMRGPIYGFDQS
jgi:hypothetical protein